MASILAQAALYSSTHYKRMHTHSLTWAQRSGVFVGAVGAVIYAIAGEVCAYAELTLLTPELLAPMFWNNGGKQHQK